MDHTLCMNKPAPMDDDVLELTRKCAEAMGFKGIRTKYQPHTQVWIDDGDEGKYRLYAPAFDPAQAFELLCWLAERGSLTIDFTANELHYQCYAPPMAEDIDLPCRTTAELRLAIMRATVKVHEGRK